MLFKDILGQYHIKKHLTVSVNSGRVPHAQLFIAPPGSGALPLAIAYAQYLLCANTDGENTGGKVACNLKFDQLSHPDLHFAFPVTTTSQVKRHPVSSNFIEEWRNFVKEQPYASLFDWYRYLGVDNKQGQIGVDEAHEIVKSLRLKSYEGGYKIMLIWMAEKMNAPAANKLLKLIEEPPDKTIFILISEDETQILQTIRSRCQILHFPPLSESVIKKALEDRSYDEMTAASIAHRAQGNFNTALQLTQKKPESIMFEKWFISWVRSAFKAKGNKTVVTDLIAWSETIAATGREVQKQFLHYCIEAFRQALLFNYEAQSLVHLNLESHGFQLAKFAPFIHGNNIVAIVDTLENAIYHVERNGNAKIVFTDLSMQLTRLLHKK